MASALKQVRILHFGFLTAWFFFLLMFRLLNPPERILPTILPTAFGLVCASNIGLALVLRARLITGSAEILQNNPADDAALARWRLGNLVSFVFAETVTLFGVCLKFLGAGWRVSGIFFAIGLLLLVAWTPRLETP